MSVAERSNRTPGQRVITAVEVESEIMRLSDGMDDELSVLVDVAQAAAEAEYAYKVGYAQAVLKAANVAGSGRNGLTTVDERENMALRDSDSLLRAHLVADVLYEVAREKLRTMRSQIDALRTIAANIRAQS